MKDGQGLTLSDALRHYSGPEDLAEYDRLEKFDLPFIYTGREQTYEDRLQMEFHALRYRLHQELIQRLESGELVGTAIEFPRTLDSKRQPIPVDLWRRLKLDFKKNLADADGMILVDILVFPRDRASQTEAMASVPFTHSDDYSNATLYGRRFEIRGLKRRKIVEILDDARLSGHPKVHMAKLLEDAECKSSRMHDVFKGMEGWKDLIATDGQGYYWLNI